MDTLFTLISPELLLFSFAVTLLAGVVKGAVGFAMPLIMVSGMGVLLDPKLVIAGIILPIVMSNILQVAKAGWGEAWAALKEYRVYVGIVCVMILITSQFVKLVKAEDMLLGLGIAVIALCALQLSGLKLIIPPQHRQLGAVISGFMSGVLGGFAGTWGPTTVLYLVAVETPKAKQFVVQGVVYGLGSWMLLAGHIRSGLMNAQTVQLSAVLLLPAFIGMWLGFRIHDRIDQTMFRKATLWVLLIAGLNLVRRGLA